MKDSAEPGEWRTTKRTQRNSNPEYYTFEHVLAECSKIYEQKNAIRGLRKDVSSLRSKVARVAEQQRSPGTQKIYRLQRRATFLRSVLKEQQARTKRLRGKRRKCEKQVEDSATSLQNNYTTQLVLVHELERHDERYEADKQQFEKLKFLLRLRRHRMCFALSQLFKIMEVHMKRNNRPQPRTRSNFAINNVLLPHSVIKIYELMLEEEEMIATGLGYVCQLLQLLAKYLGIPLRYRLLCKGSKSQILDPLFLGEQNRQRKANDNVFPLYVAGEDKRRCERALTLLLANIKQICDERGIRVTEPNVLENMRRLVVKEAVMPLSPSIKGK